ncbi:hypothetical protein ACFVT5_40990 [Streptomyces sp. NPDC058001]|uniref:hypothetical protein n=1 Tax=Streptomyces sp. NPDC058001 TaxID=3346300 RepID=UPI0036E3D88F
MPSTPSPLTEQQLDAYAEAAVLADHTDTGMDPAIVTSLVDEVRRLEQQRRFLLRQIAKKDAASGAGDRALREFLGAEEQPEPDIAAADNPTLLRWGLNDVQWGDDDTVTVVLSGPQREPYWLELDPERAAVLRQDLAGPDGEDGPCACGEGVVHGTAAECPTAPTRHLEDGSTHTVQALEDAGEACVQHQCTAAREEDRLRQDEYRVRAAVEGVLDEVAGLAEDGRVTAEVAAELRGRLRDALGLDRPIAG